MATGALEGRTAETFDVIVVGSGAAGGWAAKELTERGRRVLLLEAGPLFPQDIRGGVRRGNLHEQWPVQSKATGFNRLTADYFVDDLRNPYSVPDGRPFNWIRGRQLGGRMHLWGRVTLRLSDAELRAATGDGHGHDWPITADDLAPHYERVERFLGITGTPERLPCLPDSVFERPAPLSRPQQRLKEGAEARWPERRVIQGRLAIGTHARTLAAAAATGNLTIRPEAIVRSVWIDDHAPRARGVHYIDQTSGRACLAEARAVVLCASAFESVRILLNSQSARFPDGIGAASGALGRYLLDHTSGAMAYGVAADVPEEHGADHNPLCHIPNFCQPGDGFLRGYGTHIATLSPSGLFAGEDQELARHLTHLHRRNSTMVVMWCFGEVLARRENQLRLARGLVDAWGIPALHIDFTHSTNEHRMVEHQRRFLGQLAETAGLQNPVISPSLAPPGSSIHELGGARMGLRPDDSVLDSQNRCWEIPNLLVTDGACFASAGWQNPALSIMAITARACQQLARDLS